MKRSGAPRSETAPSQLADLIDLRDELASIKNLTAATYMAAHALSPGTERAALTELTNVARERLEAVLSRLDGLNAEPAERPRERAAPARPQPSKSTLGALARP